MESKEIYKESYDELVRIKKTLSSDDITIHFGKMDANSKEMMRQAIIKAASARQSSILTVLNDAGSAV